MTKIMADFSCLLYMLGKLGVFFCLNLQNLLFFPDLVPTGMYKVVIIAKLTRYDKLRKAMNDVGVTGMTVTQVMGCGIQKGAGERYRGAEVDATLLPKVKVEVIVGNIPVENIIEAAKKALYTGHIGDGKIFVYNVDKVIKIRTGEENLAALADVE